MLQELADESKNQGPKMTSIYVNNTQIENVESYIYLGQRYSTKDKNQDKEIQRRMTAGWTAFSKHRDIFKGNIGTCMETWNKDGKDTWVRQNSQKDMIEQVRRQVDLGRACRHDTR